MSGGNESEWEGGAASGAESGAESGAASGPSAGIVLIFILWCW